MKIVPGRRGDYLSTKTKNKSAMDRMNVGDKAKNSKESEHGVYMWAYLFLWKLYSYSAINDALMNINLQLRLVISRLRKTRLSCAGFFCYYFYHLGFNHQEKKNYIMHARRPEHY